MLSPDRNKGISHLDSPDQGESCIWDSVTENNPEEDWP